MRHYITRVQTLKINWAKDPLYTVTKSTMIAADYGRKCWYCGGAFEIGDEVAVAGTSEGNIILHSRCFRKGDTDQDED